MFHLFILSRCRWTVKTCWINLLYFDSGALAIPLIFHLHAEATDLVCIFSTQFSQPCQRCYFLSHHDNLHHPASWQSGTVNLANIWLCVGGPLDFTFPCVWLFFFFLYIKQSSGMRWGQTLCWDTFQVLRLFMADLYNTKGALQIVNERFSTTISSISLLLSLLVHSLSLWRYCLAWQNGKMISFGNRCDCVFMAALALTWPTHLPTNAHTFPHSCDRWACNSVTLTDKSQARTQAHRQRVGDKWDAVVNVSLTPSFQ